MTINDENESIASPYLMNMIHKLDERKPGTRGYITQVPELKGILSEITPLVSVGVFTHPNHNREGTDMVKVEITFSMTLSRSEMQELQETHDAARKARKE